MPQETTWPDAITAVKQALSLEASVTQKLRNIAITCEDPGKEGDNVNDYHVIVYLPCVQFWLKYVYWIRILSSVGESHFELSMRYIRVQILVDCVQCIRYE